VRPGRGHEEFFGCLECDASGPRCCQSRCRVTATAIRDDRQQVLGAPPTPPTPNGSPDRATTTRTRLDQQARDPQRNPTDLTGNTDLTRSRATSWVPLSWA
jgi:hypothetical protein